VDDDVLEEPDRHGDAVAGLPARTRGIDLAAAVLEAKAVMAVADARRVDRTLGLSQARLAHITAALHIAAPLISKAE
jgi:hypothetical protein